MLHKQQGGAKLQNELFELYAGYEVNIIERLVPDVQMRRRCERNGERDLFLLPVAVSGNVAQKELAAQVEFV